MRITDAILFTYDALGGSIQGKTNLQKKMYFLGIILQEEFGYGAHYYGPYSAEVAAANQELKALGYLAETKAAAGAVDASGFEIVRHDFHLTEDGRTVLRDKKVRMREDWERVKTAAEQLKRAGTVNYVEISIAAKAYFLLNAEGKPARAEDLVRMAGQFGWNITEDQVNKAAQFLSDMELARMVA